MATIKLTIHFNPDDLKESSNFLQNDKHIIEYLKKVSIKLVEKWQIPKNKITIFENIED
jgi:hypothetical protein